MLCKRCTNALTCGNVVITDTIIIRYEKRRCVFRRCNWHANMHTHLLGDRPIRNGAGMAEQIFQGGFQIDR